MDSGRAVPWPVALIYIVPTNQQLSRWDHARAEPHQIPVSSTSNTLTTTAFRGAGSQPGATWMASSAEAHTKWDADPNDPVYSNLRPLELMRLGPYCPSVPCCPPLEGE